MITSFIIDYKGAVGDPPVGSIEKVMPHDEVDGVEEAIRSLSTLAHRS